ncbi:response regulator [uncultured Neptuniibacter sp.]|uniref:response regulator n=1 Tax=uncultured Neptuniibacter sp. TaxID=502143 RepID=UPI00260938D6|nr:response regulator [uncultured Neptuniibacter sp.]
MVSLTSADLNILLVEPSAVQRKIIRQEFQRECVDAIDEADSVQSALARIKAVCPDLVVSALYLPDGSAMDILDTIRSDEATADLPFMLISSETRHEQLDQFKQAGVIAILPKPFNSEHLGTAINSTLDLLSQHDLELEYYDPAALRVLVVDDSRMARNIIIRVLETLGISHITQAVDGSEAIQLLNQGFDLVITDYNMPEINGLELTEHIRNSGDYSHLPVLMVSSEASQAHLSNISRSGVNALTDKPFEPAIVKQLLARILEE